MWIERTPRRYDFCGRPPCPLCYCWAGDNGENLNMSFFKFTQDLLGKEKPTAEDIEEGTKAAHALHTMAPVAVSPPPQDIDIGETFEHVNGMFKQIFEEKKAAAAPPRVLTCDEIADRLAEQKKEFEVIEKEKQRERVEVEASLAKAKVEAYKTFLEATVNARQRAIDDASRAAEAARVARLQGVTAQWGRPSQYPQGIEYQPGYQQAIETPYSGSLGFLFGNTGN